MNGCSWSTTTLVARTTFWSSAPPTGNSESQTIDSPHGAYDHSDNRMVYIRRKPLQLTRIIHLKSTFSNQHSALSCNENFPSNYTPSPSGKTIHGANCPWSCFHDDEYDDCTLRGREVHRVGENLVSVGWRRRSP